MAGTLCIQKQSITEMDVDCIVNAANSQLRHGGGVCGAIFAAAGARELQAACDALGHCPTGEAVITPGFRLKAKYIVHAVGPIWQGGNCNEEKLLYNCYQNAMKVACARGLPLHRLPADFFRHLWLPCQGSTARANQSHSGKPLRNGCDHRCDR